MRCSTLVLRCLWWWWWCCCCCIANSRWDGAWVSAPVASVFALAPVDDDDDDDAVVVVLNAPATAVEAEPFPLLSSCCCNSSQGPLSTTAPGEAATERCPRGRWWYGLSSRRCSPMRVSSPWPVCTGAGAACVCAAPLPSTRAPLGTIVPSLPTTTLLQALLLLLLLLVLVLVLLLLRLALFGCSSPSPVSPCCWAAMSGNRGTSYTLTRLLLVIVAIVVGVVVMVVVLLLSLVGLPTVRSQPPWV